MTGFSQLEAAIRRDPGRRGLASYRHGDGKWLCAGHLEKAATDLARRRDGIVLLVTGFCILTDDGPKAETDGPPGTVYLADRLRRVGRDVIVATDRYGAGLVRAGFEAAGIETPPVLEFPVDAGAFDSRRHVAVWGKELTSAARVSHLIAIERVGPSYDDETISAEDREAFLSLVEAEHRGVCHNMRGVSLDRYTAPAHLLFDDTHCDDGAGAPRPTSIGVVDGGNEIGSGTIPWSVLRRAIKQGPAERTACRVRTDATVIAGVSNWGAYALGAAVAALSGGAGAVDGWTSDRLRAVIEGMVRDAGAVDGVTKRREATVDGLPLETELGMLDEVQAIARGA